MRADGRKQQERLDSLEYQEDQEMAGTRARVTQEWPRFAALFVAAALAAPCVSVALTALRAPAVVAHVVAGVLALAGAALAHIKVPKELAALGKGAHLLFVLWLILAAGAIYKVSNLALFIDDVSRTEHAFQRQFREMDAPELKCTD